MLKINWVLLRMSSSINPDVKGGKGRNSLSSIYFMLKMCLSLKETQASFGKPKLINFMRDCE